MTNIMKKYIEMLYKQTLNKLIWILQSKPQCLAFIQNRTKFSVEKFEVLWIILIIPVKFKQTLQIVTLSRQHRQEISCLSRDIVITHRRINISHIQVSVRDFHLIFNHTHLGVFNTCLRFLNTFGVWPKQKNTAKFHNRTEQNK